MVAESPARSPPIFRPPRSTKRRDLLELSRPNVGLGDKEASGVGELGRAALLERPRPLAEVVRLEQRQLTLLLALERRLQLDERRGVDRVLGLAQRHHGS